jgi:tRNA (guanine-N7-)-methyltransferase
VRRAGGGARVAMNFVACPSYARDATLRSRARMLRRCYVHVRFSSMHPHRELIVEPVGLDVETLPKPLSWEYVFGNSSPVELEIGIGKGTFLLEQAKSTPAVNFFGVEYARWFWRYASDRLRRHGCTNARTARAEASFFLREFVRDGSLSVVHIYFPDPWPKKRHHKRRLIQPAFMREVVRVLAPDGRLQVVTDHKDYFEQIEQVVSSSGMRVVDYNRPGSAADGEYVGTNFERKYEREGRPFYAIAAVK